MRKMGWRDGQGVGPRVTLEQRRKQAAELGTKLDEADDDDAEAHKHYFAPIDRPLTLLNGVGAGQDKGWGLGYKPEKGIERSGRRGAGMDLDDDDPYGSHGSMPELGAGQKGRIGVVDLEDDYDPYEMDRTGAGRRNKAGRSSASRTTQVFHDGHPVIPGFRLDTRSSPVASTSQLPPPPPPDWQPSPPRLWQEGSTPAPGGPDKGKGRQLDADERGELLGERLPAPPPADPATKSVFDYLSTRSRERLEALKTGQSAPGPTTSTNSTPLANLRPGYGNGAASAPAPSQPVAPDVPLEVPQLDAVTAKAALRGFQPFSDKSTSPDPIKHARYQLFLQYASSMPAPGTPLPFGPRRLPSGVQQTTFDFNRELDEYAQAARVFKPVSGMLAGRFATAAAGSLDVKQVEPGLYQPPPKPAGISFAAEGEAVPVEEKKLTPAEQAVKDGNFGLGTTRKVERWRPAALLCKRFGVPDPYKGQPKGEEEEDAGGAWGAPSSTTAFAPSGRAGVGEALSAGSMEAMMQSAGFKRFETQVGDVPPAPHGEDVLGDMSRTNGSTAPSTDDIRGNAQSQVLPPPTLGEVGLGDDERQGEEVLTQTRAPKDVFSAIFADSDDEDSEFEDGDEPGAALPPPDEPAPPEPTPADLEAETVLRPEDVASYRPTFAPISSNTGSESINKPKTKKKQASKRAALSFDMDEGEEDLALAIKPKKRKADKVKPAPIPQVRAVIETVKAPVAVVEEEDDGDWVEAPSVGVELSPAPAPAPVPASAGVRPGRARASDLF